MPVARYPADPRKPRSKSRFVGTFHLDKASTLSRSIQMPSSLTIRPNVNDKFDMLNMVLQHV
ncbi:hypothetical protein AN958_10516 [Leucoagaricus sp. SymC.cos]|nr:hypothetical protein AN958_10516 [Leucoagaricus sp. SymC.cos]